MFGEVTCKECDLIVAQREFEPDNTIAIQTLRYSMLDHGRSTGHTLLRLTITPDKEDLKGEFNHDT